MAIPEELDSTTPSSATGSLELAPGEIDEASSGQATAKKALELLARRGYVVPTPVARRNVAMAFAAADKVVYGKAFDALRIEGTGPLDLSDLDAVQANLARLRLYEVKSTRRNMDETFKGHFFSLSTAEQLVAQSLGAQFGFVFVNVKTEAILELTLQGLYSRAIAIYPGWSVRF